MTSKQVAAVPLKSKRLGELEEAVRTVLETSVISRIRTLISDRESAVLSQKFRDSVKEQYGTRVKYLHGRSKAFLAELYIRHVKSHLSMAVQVRREGGDPQYKNWVRHLPNVVKNLNRKFVRGTRFRRNTVDDSNFDALLDELYETDASSLWNRRVIPGRSITSPKLQRRIFRFRPGQLVRVNKKALCTKGRFEKTSVQGGYEKKTFKVTSRSLRSSGDKFLIPGFQFIRCCPNSSLLFHNSVHFPCSVPPGGTAGLLLPDRACSGKVSGAMKRLALDPSLRFTSRRLALLSARSQPGSDLLEFNMVSSASEGVSSSAKIIDVYSMGLPRGLRGEKEDEETDVEGDAPAESDMMAAGEYPEQPPPRNPTPPPAPLALEFEALVDWKSTKHTATIREPYKPGKTIADFVTKWTPYHQGNLDNTFQFLEIKPQLMFIPSGRFTLVLPPGCAAYTDDPLFWSMLGFGRKYISAHNYPDGSTVYGAVNTNPTVSYLTGEESQRALEFKVEDVLTGPRAFLDLKEHQPKEVKITFELQKNMRLTLRGRGEHGGLLDVANKLCESLIRQSNLAHLYVLAEDAGDGKVELKARQVTGVNILLHLRPSESAARILGMNPGTSVLHFGRARGAAEGYLSTLTLTLPPDKKESGEAATGHEESGAEEEEEEEEKEEEEEEEEEIDDEEAVEGEQEEGAGRLEAERGPEQQRGSYLQRLAPFSVVLVGQRGGSFVQGLGTVNVACYCGRNSKLTAAEIRVAGDQSVLSVKILQADLSPHVFRESVRVFLVLEMFSLQ